jgi:hypothetical protein
LTHPPFFLPISCHGKNEKNKNKNRLKFSCQVTLSKEDAPKVIGLLLRLEGVVPSKNPPLYLDA